MEHKATYLDPKTAPNTPWGKADMMVEYSDEVTFFATPSHGGFRVKGASLERIPSEYRETKYSQGWHGWFEEDCDWAIVAWYIPEIFDAEARDHARYSLQHYNQGVLSKDCNPVWPVGETPLELAL